MKSKKHLFAVPVLVAMALVISLTLTPLGGVSKALATPTYGNATAGNLLSGCTATVDAGQITGTMPNKTGAGVVLTPSATDQAFPQGYYPGGLTDGKVAGVVVPVANVLAGTTIAGQAGTMPNQPSNNNPVSTAVWLNGSNTQLAFRIPFGAYLTPTPGIGYPEIQCVENNLVSNNIKAGASIFGVAGKSSVVDTGDANASAGQILSGQTSYVNGAKITGSMPNNGGATTTIASNGGSYVVPAGYTSGGTVTSTTDANLIPANILSGKSIFGVAGTAINGAGMKRVAVGTYNVGFDHLISVSGLSFTPGIVIAHNNFYLGPYAIAMNVVSGIYGGNMNQLDTKFMGSYSGPQTTQTFSMTSDGFTIDVSEGNATYQWIAIEQ